MTADETVEIVGSAGAGYVIVRSDIANEAEITAAVSILRAIEKCTGVRPDITTDWDGDTDNSGRKEILVGATNRPQSVSVSEGLDKYSYAIKIEGPKIVIAGGSDEALEAAANEFIGEYLNDKKETFTLDKTLNKTGVLSGPKKLYADADLFYEVESISLLTNSSDMDAKYLFENKANANENVRFADGKSYYTYLFDLSDKYEPKLMLSICQNYLVEVSGDNENFIVAAQYGDKDNVLKNATNLVDITIDPYEFDIVEKFYVRISDSNPDNGWGGSTTKLSFSYLKPQDSGKGKTYFINTEDYKTVDKLSFDIQPSGLADYMLHSDGGLIYNPISREKAKSGMLDKYSGASDLISGSISLGGITLSYWVPRNVTAYDAVPINYKLSGDLSSAGSSGPIHISAAALEDAQRANGNCYYDLNLPGIVDFDFEYMGYVVAQSDVTARAKLENAKSMDSDIKASYYPHYQTSELRRSGTVEAGYSHWFRFDYTYKGDTVLDGDGNGTFCFEPILYKKNDKGQYEKYATVENLFYRIENDLYPGESGTLWVTFNPPASLPEGEYKIAVNGIVRNETTNPENYGKNIWGGETYFTASQAVTIKASKIQTEPDPISQTHKIKYSRNKWLHSFEEFGSSYVSYLKPAALDETEEGTIYLQCAPWTNQVVLKLLTGDKAGLAAVSLPVEVESDSIKLTANVSNENYVVKEDGTRFPVIMAQAMTDMRGNQQLGPDPAANIVNMLLNAAEAGVNVFTSTAAFEHDSSHGTKTADNIDAFWFTADVLRLLGIKMEGFGTYPYESSGNIAKGNWAFGQNLSAGGIGSKSLAQAVGYKSAYQYLRWGDNWWVGGGPTIALSIEDTRGWMRIDYNARMPLSAESKMNFRNYLREYYETIEALNKAWGTEYNSFIEIEPEEGTTEDHGYRAYKNKAAVLKEWSRRTLDFDCYRTLERALDYKLVLETASEYIPNAKINLRTEGANWMATVPYDTENSHFRHVFYSQRRNAMIPELLGGDAQVLYLHSDYTTLPYTPSEVSILTKSSISNGVIPALLPQYDRMRDIAINSRWGNDYTYEYNLEGKNKKGAYINTVVSVFEWMRATYEAGGIPGICGQDYLCDGYANETQRKEIRFFADKLAEALSAGEGLRWATEFTYDDSVLSGSNKKYTFETEFVQSVIDRVKSER